MIKLYFDGACGPNNPGGKCGGGAVVHEDGKMIAEIAKNYIPIKKGETSNNLGEYIGLICGLEYLIANGRALEEIKVYGDSNMVISQMTKKWRIKKGIYEKQAKVAENLIKNFPNIKFSWIPREQNDRADGMSKIALTKSLCYNYD